jgi:hypothetical protein
MKFLAYFLSRALRMNPRKSRYVEESSRSESVDGTAFSYLQNSITFFTVRPIVVSTA